MAPWILLSQTAILNRCSYAADSYTFDHGCDVLELETIYMRLDIRQISAIFSFYPTNIQFTLTKCPDKIKAKTIQFLSMSGYINFLN